MSYVLVFQYFNFGTDSTCLGIKSVYYLPLGMCIQATNAPSNCSCTSHYWVRSLLEYKGKWVSSESSNTTKTITLNNYSKGKCRGTVSTGWSDSTPAQCTAITQDSNDTYTQSLFNSDSQDDMYFDLSNSYGIVILNLYKTLTPCQQSRDRYHLSEQAIVVFGSCLQAVGFAGGYDIRIDGCPWSIAYTVYASNDGSCTTQTGTNNFYNYDICSDTVSLSGHGYGYLNFVCYQF